MLAALAFVPAALGAASFPSAGTIVSVDRSSIALGPRAEVVAAVAEP